MTTTTTMTILHRRHCRVPSPSFWLSSVDDRFVTIHAIAPIPNINCKFENEIY
jgi:hypothetical protein